MLATLTSVKARLAIPELDTQYDAILTAAIQAVSARFDLECNRTLARTVGATHEFPADDVHIPVPCYPIEAVTKFETKATESDGWVEVLDVSYLLRNRCVISLAVPLSAFQRFSVSAFPLARVVYTGGYALPGTVPAPPVPPATPLPPDLEQAAIEQVVFWFQTRDSVGATRLWPSGGNYVQFADVNLMPSVRAVLRRHTRFLL